MHKTFSSLKKFIIFIIILILVFILIFIVLNLDNIKKINEIKKFITDDVKVLYITDEKNYSQYPVELFDKYEVDYMYIDTSSLSIVEKRNLEKLINNKYLNTIIVIFKDGKIEDAIIDFESKESLNLFLQNNNIIPKVIGKVDGIIDSIFEYKEADLSLLYIPYDYINGIDEQDKILKDICNQLDIKYNMVNAYLLSEFQKQRLNAILEVSSVEDQIVVLIKDKKIIGNIRGIKTKDEYLKILDKYDLKGMNASNFNYIEYSKLFDIMDSLDKSVFLIGDDTKECEEIINILNKLSKEYNFMIYYLTIPSNDYLDFENKLLELGYDSDIHIPLVLVAEANNILNYSVGLSDENYFIEIFKESGIIK